MVDYNKSSTVIKLAVIGDVHDDASRRVIPNDQIKNFQYTVIGTDAYKFVIELVNYDDSFLSSVVKSLQAIVRDADTPDYTDFGAAENESTLRSLPKILVQFGYEDHNAKEVLSHVHFATISNAKYKFTQGQEKILVLDAVFNSKSNPDPEDLSTYASKQIVDVIFPDSNTPEKTLCEFKPAQAGTGYNKNDDILFLDIVRGVIKDLIGSKDGTEFLYLAPDKGQYRNAFRNERRRIERALSKKTPPLPDGFWDSTKMILAGALSPIDNLKKLYLNFPGHGDQKEFIQHYMGWGEAQWDQLELLFKELGLDLTRRYGHYTPWNELGKWADGFFDDAADMATAARDVIAEKTLGEGSFVDRVVDAGSRIWSGSEQRLTYVIQATAGGIGKDNIQNLLMQDGLALDVEGYPSYWEAEITTKYDDTNYQLSVGKEANITAKIVRGAPTTDGGDLVGKTYTVKFNGDENLFHYDPPDSNTLNFGESAFLKDRWAKIADELNDKRVERMESDAADILKDEEEEKQKRKDALENPTPESDGFKISNMSHSDKRDMFNRNVEVAAISASGTTTFATAKSILKAYNKLFANGRSDDELELVYHCSFSAGDFNDILSYHEGDPLKTRTTHAVLGFRPAINEYKETLKDFEVLSSPITEESDNHKTLYLDYGKTGSITKYFDFTGDVRWLRNINTAIATNHYVDNVYSFLETDTIQRSFSSIIPLLLKDKKFIKAMQEANDKVNLDKPEKKHIDIEETLNILLAQLLDQLQMDGNKKNTDHDTPVQALTPEQLESLNYVSTYIEEGDSENYLKSRLGDDFKEKMSSFNLFLAGLANSESLKLLMDYKKAYHGYIIKPSNMFDNIAGDDRSTDLKDVLATYQNNINMFAEVKLKTLGIPELTLIADFQRPVRFTIYDPSKNTDSKHWLSGIYKITALSHNITSSDAYSSELTLLKINAST